ncbi:GNAT family N-acetyltransferase [Patescibacteria group bacterium]|nr:GNAT family N-acetyltransferase [Patescibacteria group bacterium]
MSAADEKITISQIKFEDIAPIYNLGNRLYTSNKWSNLYRTWDEYEIIERYISDKEYCHVAKANNQLVGFALATLVEKKNNPWLYGYIIWMGVDPKHSGKGIGSKLLKKITKLFKKDGVKIIMVDTSIENKQALSFFKKNGFEEEEGHVFLSKNVSKN